MFTWPNAPYASPLCIKTKIPFIWKKLVPGRGIIRLHSFIYYIYIRMLFFPPRLNILIFLSILGWKYSCIILKLNRISTHKIIPFSKSQPLFHHKNFANFSLNILIEKKECTRATLGEPIFHTFPYKLWRTIDMRNKKLAGLEAGSPAFLDCRVTLLAVPTLTLASPTWSTGSRRDNQNMHERSASSWLEQRG